MHTTNREKLDGLLEELVLIDQDILVHLCEMEYELKQLRKKHNEKNRLKKRIIILRGQEND